MRLFDTPYGLRGAFIAIVLIPLVAVAGGGGWIVLREVEERVEARMQDDIALIARALRTPLARSLERRREVSLDRSLRSASELGRVYGVYLYDSNGALIAQGDRSPAGAPRAPARLTSGDADVGEYRSVDGREVYSYFTPLIGSGGQAIGVLQVTRRASDIRDYLTALRTSVGIITLALAGVFVAVVVVGYDFVIGRPLQRLARTMERVAVGDADARADVSGPAELRRLGQRFNAMLAGLAERDAALSRERAEQQQLEDRLRQSEKYALVGRLAAGVAHELGTPLSVIDGHVQRLARKPPGDSDREALSRIRESVERMGTIVRQLLGFGGEASPGRRLVPVRRLVTLAAADLRAKLERDHTRLEVAPGPLDACVSADEPRLREALVHLLRNAAQATPSGEIRIGWDEDESATRIFVENAGEPISLEQRDRIFEPFFTTKAPGEGSGLGLAIVKSAVADQGADIELYDSPLGGAGFRIMFGREARAPRRAAPGGP